MQGPEAKMQNRRRIRSRTISIAIPQIHSSLAICLARVQPNNDAKSTECAPRAGATSPIQCTVKIGDLCAVRPYVWALGDVNDLRVAIASVVYVIVYAVS